MGQDFYSPEELDHILAEMKLHQRRDVLLRIDEILAALDKSSSAVKQREAERISFQLVDGNEFAAMTSVPADAHKGDGHGIAIEPFVNQGHFSWFSYSRGVFHGPLPYPTRGDRPYLDGNGGS